MNEYKFTIPERLPSLNEFYSQAKGRKGNIIANKTKRDIEDRIMQYASIQIRQRALRQPVIIDYHWIESNRKRDLDNISFAKKFINDALVKSGILQGDGWRDIREIYDRFSVDKENPRVEVTIYELNNG